MCAPVLSLCCDRVNWVDLNMFCNVLKTLYLCDKKETRAEMVTKRTWDVPVLSLCMGETDSAQSVGRVNIYADSPI